MAKDIEETKPEETQPETETPPEAPTEPEATEPVEETPATVAEAPKQVSLEVDSGCGWCGKLGLKQRVVFCTKECKESFKSDKGI